jgi:hypothetical protein
LRYALDPTAGSATRDYGLALAAGAIAAFFAVVGPAHWTQGYCDAIGISWVALVVVAGVGLAFAGRRGGGGRQSRLAAIGIVGAAAIAAFVVIEPRCLGGPYGQVDGAVA